MKTQPVSPTLLIKQELIPVEVDNIPSGKRFSPIIIDDSEGTASDVEVDAQMDEDELEPSQPNNGGQDSSDELEYLDNVEPRRIVSVSSPEENGDMEVEEPSKEPEEGSPKALSKELSREVSEEPAEHAVDEIAGGVEAQEEETGEKQVNEEGEGEKENDDKEDDEKEDDEEEDEMMDEEPAEGAPEPAQPEASEEPTKVSSAQVSRESTREPTQAPRNETSPSKEPEETTTQDDEKRDATPKKTTRSPSVPHPTLSPSVPPLPHSASSSSPEPEPTGDLARYIHLFRPTPKPKSMEPAASQPPPSTSKRPFSALEPAQSQPPRPRAAPKRKEFLRYVPATQPAMSATAPARASAASTPTAASLDRAKTISDGSDDDGDATRHKKRAKRSKSRSPAVARGSLHVAQAPGKAHRRPSKHAEHWHTDGSVIIQLQDIAFRLHRSRLAQQSKFFAELFRGTKEVVESDQDDLQVSAWREGQMDSQPLYVVKGVSPEDFAILLNALDNAINYVFEPPTFSDLAAILRSSLPLAFAALTSFATHALHAMWPSALPSSAVPIRGRPEHAEETVVLARACGQPALLKRAFYELLRAPGLGQNVDEEFIIAGARDRAWHKAAPADLARLIKTREELASAWARAAALPPDTRALPCPLAHAPGEDAPAAEDARRCAAAHAAFLATWRDEVLNSDLYTEYMNDPVAGLEKLAEVRWEEKGFCQGCVKSWRGLWGKQREKIWANLDLWLGLPAENSQQA